MFLQQSILEQGSKWSQFKTSRLNYDLGAGMNLASDKALSGKL